MNHASYRMIRLGMAIVGFAAVTPITLAVAQTGPGWITLLDGTKMGDWDRVGDSNWRLEEGAVVADKRTSQATAFLVSKMPWH